MSRIAIVGSRPPPVDWPDADHELFKNLCEMVIDLIETFPEDTVIISGGAAGVDRLAAGAADELRLGLVEHLPRGEDGDARFHRRNQRIVDDADSLHAFVTPWARGTWDSVRRARKKGIPCHIHRSTYR